MGRAQQAGTRVAFVGKQFVWVCIDEKKERRQPELIVEVELTQQCMRLLKSGEWSADEDSTLWARVIGLVGTARRPAEKVYQATCENEPEDVARIAQELAHRFVDDLIASDS